LILDLDLRFGTKTDSKFWDAGLMRFEILDNDLNPFTKKTRDLALRSDLRFAVAAKVARPVLMGHVVSVADPPVALFTKTNSIKRG